MVLLAFVAALLGLVAYRFHANRVSTRYTDSEAAWKLTDIPWVKQIPHTTASHAGQPKAEVIRRSRGAGADWASLFASSRDYFAFVKRAAYAAFRGDGAAALYVSRALDVCHLQVALYGSRPNPKVAFQTWLSAQTHTPELAVAIQQRDFDLCKGFFKGNAFADLPPPSRGSYLSALFWRNLAYQDDNPIAEVIHTTMQFHGVGNPGGTQGQQTVAVAQTVFVSAIASGNPEAIFRIGSFLVNGAHTSDEIRAFAVALAGCNLGFDCSGDNPAIFGNCVAGFGACPTGEDYSDIVTKAVGISGYSKAYAMAQELTEAISEGDVATIRKFVQLKN